MKALKHVALLLIALMTITSCNDNNDDIYQETWFVNDYEVRRDQWRLMGGQPGDIGTWYQFIVTGLPGGVAYDDAVITVYKYFNFNMNNNEFQAPLPYTQYGMDVNGGFEYPWSIHWSYDYARDGSIALKVTTSDFHTDIFRPDTEWFRVAIVW